MNVPLASHRAVDSERPLRLIKLPELMARTALSRSEVYRRVRDDPAFPKPARLGVRSVAWNLCAVEDWITDRIGQRSNAKAGVA